MGRPIRNFQINETTHNYSRCRNYENLFDDDNCKQIVVEVINYTADVFEFEVNSYVCMKNHFHIAITMTNSEHTVSKIMQLIKSMIAKRINKYLGFKGPFWNDRFGSTFVYYFPTLCSYLAYNAVKKGFVKDPGDWKYGSSDVYRKNDGKCDLTITLHKHFLALGATLEECFKRQLEIDEYFIS